MWNILENKIPTGTYLKKRAFLGPTWCVLCLQEEETTQHLFLSCPTTRNIWTQVLQTLNLNMSWQGIDIITAWDSWWGTTTMKNTRNLPLLVSWHIWLNRNIKIFEDKPVNWNLLPPKICAAFEELPNDECQKRPRHIRQEHINTTIPWAYFDGAAQ